LIGLFVIIFSILFLRNNPSIQFQKYPKKMGLGKSDGQYVWIPHHIDGESRSAYKRRFKALNKKTFRNKLSLVKWYLELHSLIKYPHYRGNKVTIMRAKYVTLVPWRIDWSKAFIMNPYFAPMNMPFRDYYIAKWVPDIRIQTPLRAINRQTVMMGVCMALMLIGVPAMPMMMGVPAMPMVMGANWYWHTGGNDGADGSIGTPWKTTDSFKNEYLNYSPDDNCYFQQGGDFRDSVTGGGTAYLSVRANGTAGHVITITGYGTGADPIVERVYGLAEYTTLDSVTVDNTVVGAVRCITFSEETVNCRGVSIIDCTVKNGSDGIIFFGHGNKSTCLVTGCIMEQGGTGVGFYFDSGTNGVHSTDISFYNCTINNPGTDGFTLHEGGSDTQYYTEGPIVIHDIIFTGLVTHTEELIDIVTGTFVEMYNIDVTFVGTGVGYGHSAGVNADTANGQVHIHHCIFDQPVITQQTAINISGRNLRLYNCLIISDGSRSVINIADSLFSTRPAPGVNTGYSIDGIEITYCTLLDSGITGYGLIYYVHDSASGFEDGGVVVRNTIHTSAEVTMNTKMFHIGGTQSASYPLNHACLDLNYNIYYDPNNAAEYGIPGELWADLQTAGHEANGQEANPLLADRTGATDGWPNDAKILVGSPCINNALVIGAGNYYDENGTLTVGITVDYYGNLRATDIGFNEYTILSSIASLYDVQFYDIEFTCDI